MNWDNEEIKTFSQAHDRLKDMAAGRNYAVQVEQTNYMGVRLGLYIENVTWIYGTTWTAVFADMEAALYPDDATTKSLAGVDDVINGATQLEARIKEEEA